GGHRAADGMDRSVDCPGQHQPAVVVDVVAEQLQSTRRDRDPLGLPIMAEGVRSAGERMVRRFRHVVHPYRLILTDLNASPSSNGSSFATSWARSRRRSARPSPSPTWLACALSASIFASKWSVMSITTSGSSEPKYQI